MPRKRTGYDAACYYDGKLLGRCTKADSDAYTLLMNACGGEAARVLREFPNNEHKGRRFNLAGNQVVRFDFGHERIELRHIGEQIELLLQYFLQPYQCPQTRLHILLIECALLYLVVGNLARQNHVHRLAWTIPGQGNIFQIMEPRKVRKVLW